MYDRDNSDTQDSHSCGKQYSGNVDKPEKSCKLCEPLDPRLKN